MFAPVKTTLRVADLVCVSVVAEPILQSKVELKANRYGTDKVDQIVNFATPAIEKIPVPRGSTVPYDNTPIPWNKNPIDRVLIPPLPVPAGPDPTIYTNRHILLYMLYIFLFPDHSPYNYLTLIRLLRYRVLVALFTFWMERLVKLQVQCHNPTEPQSQEQQEGLAYRLRT